VVLVDSAVETAKEIKNIIKINSIAKESKTVPRREFFVTDSPERFVNVGERFLEQKIEHIEKINLGG
jgi:glutamate racemase